MHVLLLHGAIGAADQLQPLAAILEKEYTVHTLDFSGHGRRPFPNGPYSIPLFAADVIAFMDHVGLKEAAVFGYSMGGYVGMYLARHYAGRVSRLATLATKYHWDPAIAGREVQLLNPGKIEEKLPAFARALEQRHRPKDWKMVLTRTSELLMDMGERPPLTAEDWKGIGIPCLLLLGDNDKMVSLDETLAMYKSIGGAQLGILPGTPHPIEQVDATVLACLLRRFYKVSVT